MDIRRFRNIMEKNLFSSIIFLNNFRINNGLFKNCLIVTSETYTKHISKDNRTCLPIFSDAASSIFIDKKSLPKMLSSYFLTDGKGANNLCLTNKDNKLEKYLRRVEELKI